MSAPDYTKHIFGSNTETVSNPVTCGNADIASSHSATLNFKKITCELNAKIFVDHSATLTIDHLECKSAVLDISYAGKLIIGHLACSGTVKIYDGYSSTLNIEKGDLGATTGKVEYSSTGVCFAKIGRDDVVAEYSSTWRT